MTEPGRAIVVGAGHNGLVCAAYLARGGWDVTVLEAADQPGGAATTREFAPGYKVSGCAHFLYQLQPKVVSELKLKKHGLALAAGTLATIALGDHGQHLRIEGHKVTGDVTTKDGDGLRQFHGAMNRYARLLQRYFNRPPPLLVDRHRNDSRTLLRLGFDLKRLGRESMQDLLRVIAINIYDVLDEHIDNEALKGALALDAVLGTHMGPRSPNSVLTYLHRLAGGGLGRGLGQPLGGMGAVAAALARCAQAAGATIRTGARVRRIRVDKGRVAGVELADGEILDADNVVSNADPKTTVLTLVGARHFDTGFVRRIANLRMRGNAAKLHLGLDALPRIAGLTDADYGQRLVIAPDRDYVERAFNPAKYGECSRRPVLEISFPSVNDPGLAPKGKHVLSAIVQYAPFDLAGGWDDAARDHLGRRAIATLARYAPDIATTINARELLTPRDIADKYLIHGGHWHHGELALDQFLFVRPVVGAAQYRLPLPGLFLCGAGTHPGGGVSGAPGRNAARTLLEGEPQP